MTVLCIKDNWDNKPLLGTWPVVNEMCDVTEVYEDQDGVFYKLKGYNQLFLWHSTHFVKLVPDDILEDELKEIFKEELI